MNIMGSGLKCRPPHERERAWQECTVSEVILPNLLALVGEVEGEAICDLACGQGWVARELARGGAQVTGLDLAPNLLALARRSEEQEPLGIVYV